jgi:DNA polymerase I-like protein with 3'-5' exonuclease and polymerase domains
MRSECYATYVSKTPLAIGTIAKIKAEITREHQLLNGLFVLPSLAKSVTELATEIQMVQPNIIVAFGNLALWATTGLWSVAKWRGSLLQVERPEYTQVTYKIEGSLDRSKELAYSMQDTKVYPKVIPTYHPSALFKQWDLRAIVLNDLRRVKRHMVERTYSNRPVWNFIVRPTLAQVHETLHTLISQCETQPSPVWLDFDIETRYEHIDCVGLSWTRSDAICIPLITSRNREGYWSAEEEAQIIWWLYKLLTHKNVRVRWQNGLYDAQYVYRHWHFLPRGGQDTMISQHSVFCALPKSLDFIASMYCDWYVFWKDEGKIGAGTEEDRWRYNLQDCVYTREAGEVLQQTVVAMGLQQVETYQQRMFAPVLRAMRLGVRMRPEMRAQMAMDIQEELSHREAFLFNALGHGVNPKSPKQMCALFYEDFAQPKILKRVVRNGFTKMSPSCDDESMAKISAREPILRPICHAILDIRTLYKFLKDFVMMPPDTDGRMRCSFNIAGDAGDKDANKAGVKSAPYTYRLSSSKNPFGSGGNLQTIPSEKSKSAGKAAARGSMDFTLPNIRSMYGPDPGFTFFDMDLDRADLQVVVWESDDAMLKAALRMGADIHLLNTYGIDNHEPPPLEELVERHRKDEPCTCGPRCYWDYRTPRSHKREFAKTFCHATNYLGKAKTVAAHTGRGVWEIEQAQARWFAAHPGILAWHERVKEQVTKYRFVENKFGYRWYIFDRIDEQLLPAAVAWIPQSTVGIVINRAWLSFYENLPEVQVLLQVHDSLAGQFPTHRSAYLLPLMQKYSKIVVPYDDPLIIPTGIKTSTVSWGDCS